MYVQLCTKGSVYLCLVQHKRTVYIIFIICYLIDIPEGVRIGTFAGDSKDNVGFRGSGQLSQLVD